MFRKMYSSKSIAVRLFVWIVTLIIVLNEVSTMPLQRTSQAEIYLSQFGYLPARNPSSGGLIAEETWNKAIVDFQQFAGLNVTGELDSETRELMTTPRCGFKDKVGFGTHSRANYELYGGKWKTKALTYKITKYPARLQRDEVDEEIAKAFAVWSTYTDLTFTPENTKPVDIEIHFVTGDHGDDDPFDGRSGTLAHAYFPLYGGDAHFDDAEYWTIDSTRGTNLYQVAAHEFGHSLGLDHSNIRKALMAPFYSGYNASFKLHSDDIQGIQALYGRKSPSLSESNKICMDAKIDVIFNTAEGNTYAFKGDKYYRLTENAIAEGYPKLISEGWAGLPGNIDAAFTYENGNTFFFRGSEYWKYTGRQIDGGFPKQITELFTGIPNNLDAAFVGGDDNKSIYFFKGSKFWRFDPDYLPPVKSTYPKPISTWEGVPDNIDAALQYTNGYTYFFKGPNYYRFNDRTFSVDTANPPFPRPSRHWWFGCQNSPSSENQH